MSNSPDELFDVFDPWTEPTPIEPVADPGPSSASQNPNQRERAPWEPPSPEAPVEPSTPAQPGPKTEIHFTSDGAVEPGIVVPTKAPTRRRRRPTPRFIPPPASGPPPDPTENPGEFLRRVAVPEIQFMARRLEAARHYTTVQDLLDLATPTLRVLIWPRPGLLDQVGARVLATMELMLDEDSGLLTTSYWWGARPEEVIPMARISTSELTVSWTRTQVLDFLQRILDQI